MRCRPVRHSRSTARARRATPCASTPAPSSPSGGTPGCLRASTARSPLAARAIGRSQGRLVVTITDRKQYIASRSTKGSTPSRADAVGAPGDFDLAGDVQALAVEADDGERVVRHALRQQGLAVAAPRDALRPLPDFDFAQLRQLGSVDAENDQQTVIVVERMARRQI